MQENSSCRKVTYMGNVKRPETVNDTCMKTMHVVVMNRGFTVFCYEQFFICIPREINMNYTRV